MKRWHILFGIIILLYLIPLVVKIGYFTQLVSMVGIYVVLALGLNVLAGFAGQISFGHAGFYGLGAYGVAILQTKLGMPWMISMFIAVVVASLIAFLLGMPIFKLKGHFLGMATLAVGLLIFAVANQWISLSGGPDGMGVPVLKFPSAWKAVLPAPAVYYVIVLVSLLGFAISENIRNSKIGLAMRVVREDEVAAEAMGLSPLKYKTLALIISVVFSAVAGALYASLNGYVNPDPFGLDTSIAILTMVVVGGFGSSLGVLVGAVVLTVIPQLIYSLQDYHLILYGLLLIVVLVFLPGGIIGEKPSRLGLIYKIEPTKSKIIVRRNY